MNPPGPYGLSAPSLADARTALDTVFGERADAIWSRVTGRAGGEPTLPAVIAAMREEPDPVVGLCAQSLDIRLSTYEYLSAADHTIRSVQ
ncbi:hypothetical protein ACQP00_15035 [Dactylosporangium sp. CS-047395]|uniref:hypothetical protein n=1 Tax=Dactylosporangium sp. CS-047395 TaxID=3239936 RepID=UPI003D8EE020